MSFVFRAKFVAELRKNKAAISQKIYDQLFKKKWVVYAKKAFCTPSSVIEYLGRYSHKVAISNHRISNINKKEDSIRNTPKQTSRNTHSRRANKRVSQHEYSALAYRHAEYLVVTTRFYSLFIRFII